MDISSEVYNNTNKGQVADAKGLIDRILNANLKNCDLVLDIGCGSGNVTSELAKNINYQKIIGLDVDRQMVEFAKKNNQNEAIDYLIDNFELSWDQLSNDLRQLQGKCSLIFSNQVFHWFKAKNTIAKNVCNLLSPGGRIYLSITIFDYLLDHLTAEERTQVEQEIPVLNSKQVGEWQEAFENIGLNVIGIEEVSMERSYSIWLYENVLFPMVFNICKKHINDDNPDMVIKKYEDIIKSASKRTWKIKPELAEDGSNLVVVNRKIVYIIAENRI